MQGWKSTEVTDRRIQLIDGYMAGQYEILPCPFCEKGQIQCLYFPSAWSEKRKGKSSLGRGVSITKSSETWIIQSVCSSCGKTAEEVEKELRTKGII